MNWDVVSAIGEIVGAAAVVISLIYLAVQIRKQTEESRLSATCELATQYQDGLKLIAADENLTEIYLKAIRDYESLPDTERTELRGQFTYLRNRIAHRCGHSLLTLRDRHPKDANDSH